MPSNQLSNRSIALIRCIGSLSCWQHALGVIQIIEVPINNTEGSWRGGFDSGLTSNPRVNEAIELAHKDLEAEHLNHILNGLQPRLAKVYMHSFFENVYKYISLIR